MDFGIRELLIFIGVVIFIGVFVDGIRRFQQSRRQQLKVQLAPSRTEDDSDQDNIDWYAGELPNGKARVKDDYDQSLDDHSESLETENLDNVSQTEIAQRQVVPDSLQDSITATSGRAQTENNGAAQQTIQQTRHKISSTYSEPLDILMESNTTKSLSTEPVAELTTTESVMIKQDKQYSVNDVEETLPKRSSVDSSLKETQGRQEPSLSFNEDQRHESLVDIAEQNNISDDISTNELDNEKNQGDLFGLSSQQKQTATKPKKKRFMPEKSRTEPEPQSPEIPEEVLSVNVIAKSGQTLDGARLLEATETFGLRFGEMDIFHRHEHSTGQGPIIFSVASAIKPGTFDVNTLQHSSVKGVTFFMQLSQVKKRTFVLELMVDIAKRLANQLGAELKDDTHSVLSSQTVAHYKNRIQEYERRYLGQMLRK